MNRREGGVRRQQLEKGGVLAWQDWQSSDKSLIFPVLWSTESGNPFLSSSKNL